MRPSDPAEAPLVVVMGIAGVGKTATGTLLAQRLGVAYEDADEFHPQANIDKMASGTPLTDEDRWPWLEAIGAWLAEHESAGGVVSCSALRRAYREVLRNAAPRVMFLHLHGDPELIRSRIEAREGHFMPPSLLASQQQTLESLQTDERGKAYDVSNTPDDIVTAFIADVGLPVPGV